MSVEPASTAPMRRNPSRTVRTANTTAATATMTTERRCRPSSPIRRSPTVIEIDDDDDVQSMGAGIQTAEFAGDVVGEWRRETMGSMPSFDEVALEIEASSEDDAAEALVLAMVEHYRSGDGCAAAGLPEGAKVVKFVFSKLFRDRRVWSMYVPII